MTLDRPDQDSAGLAYFYSNKIPSAAKYLRLWFKGAGTGDSYYEQWQAALVSLNVKANGADPDAGKPAPTTKPTEATTKPNSTTVKPDGTTEAKPVDATTAPSETAAPSDETTTAYTGATDEFGNPVRTTAATTAAPVVITSSNAAFKIDESWKTITRSRRIHGRRPGQGSDHRGRLRNQAVRQRQQSHHLLVRRADQGYTGASV